MKIVHVMPLLAASLGLVACVGAADEDLEIDDVAKTPQICLIGRCAPPPPATPPSPDDFAVYLDTSSEMGDDVSVTSVPYPVYPNYFVAQINGLGPVPNETAYAHPTSDVPQDRCAYTTTTGTAYVSDPNLGYWYILSTKSKVGTWVPASGSGLGYVPAHCDAQITWALPGAADAVIISSRSATSWAGSYYDRQITNGVSWYN